MSEHLRKTRSAYDGMANVYDEVNKSVQPILNQLTRFQHYCIGNLVLDLGCGPGRDAAYLTKKGYTVICIDLSQELLKIARHKTRETPLILGDMRAPPIRTQTIDGIWVSASFHHLTKTDAAPTLKQLNHTLKPKGTLYLDVKKGSFTGYETSNHYGGSNRYYNYYTQTEITQLVTKNQFKIIQTQEQTQPQHNRTWITLFATKP